MSYKYQEPVPFTPKHVPAGEYDFTVVAVKPPGISKAGNFKLPVELQIKDTDIVIKESPSAGWTQLGEPYDMIAKFLKAIRRNSAVDEEPDFSAANLVGAKGRAKFKVEEFEYNGRACFGNRVAHYIYDREQASVTMSRGPAAPEKTYHQPVAKPAPAPADQIEDDNVPF